MALVVALGTFLPAFEPLFSHLHSPAVPSQEAAAGRRASVTSDPRETRNLHTAHTAGRKFPRSCGLWQEQLGRGPVWPVGVPAALVPVRDSIYVPVELLNATKSHAEYRFMFREFNLPRNK